MKVPPPLPPKMKQSPKSSPPESPRDLLRNSGKLSTNSLGVEEIKSSKDEDKKLILGDLIVKVDGFFVEDYDERIRVELDSIKLQLILSDSNTAYYQHYFFKKGIYL